MLLADVAAASRAIAATRSRLAKRALLVDLLRRSGRFLWLSDVGRKVGHGWAVKQAFST